jgi:hypothetical protein
LYEYHFICIPLAEGVWPGGIVAYIIRVFNGRRVGEFMRCLGVPVSKHQPFWAFGFWRIATAYSDVQF